MILEEETYKKFGYYPKDLGEYSLRPILITCDKCGKIRESEKRKYRALCRSCSNKREKITQICQYCKKEFEVYPHYIKQNRGKYCSHICYTKSIKNRIIRACPICGREFEIKPSIMKQGYGVYCSVKCCGKGRSKTKPERIFEALCKKNNLLFKYTGDGSFWIGKNPSVNPDFIECNGKKIAVEIFSYWHDPLKRHCKVPYSGTYKGRKKILKKYGWKLIVFWQEDLEREDAEQFVLLTLKKYL